MNVAEKQRAKRNEFVMQAMPLIQEKGYENVTVDDLCSFLEVSKGTFYHYFRDKQSFIQTLYEDTSQFFEQKVTPALPMDDPVSALKSFAEEYAKYAQKLGVELARTASFTMTDNENLHSTPCQIIGSGQKSGIFITEYEAKQLCDMFYIIIHGYVLDWAKKDGQYDLPQRVLAHMGLFIKSISA